MQICFLPCTKVGARTTKEKYGFHNGARWRTRTLAWHRHLTFFLRLFFFFWCTNFAATPCYLLFIKTGNLHGELLRVLTKKNFFSETFLLCNARWPWESNDEGSALTLSGDLSGQGQSPASPPSHEPFHHRQWPVRPLVGLQTARGGFIFQDQASLSQVWSPPQFWVFYKQGSLLKSVIFFTKTQ